MPHRMAMNPRGVHKKIGVRNAKGAECRTPLPPKTKTPRITQ